VSGTPERRILAVDGPARVLELLEVLPGRVEEVLLPRSAKGGWRTPLEERCASLGIRLTLLPWESFQRHPDRPPAAHKVFARFVHEEHGSLEPLLETPGQAGDTVLLLDGIEDPGNLGAIIRSAIWFGVRDLVLPARRAAPVTGTVAVRSAGALAHARIFRVPGLGRAVDALRAAGWLVHGSVTAGGEPLTEAPLEGPAALVVGGEAAGLHDGIRRRCDHLVTLPSAGGLGSLNASVFAGLFLYERWRRLRTQEPRRTR